KGSNKTARHNRHICFRDQHAESMLERHHRTGARASALREDDENRFFLLQFATQLCKSMRTTVFPPHRQSVEHDRGKHTNHSRLKKDVACRDRESTFAMTRPERCSQNQRVEMTAMICRKHKRPVCRQFLTARNCESMSERKVNSQYRKARLLRHAFDQTAL